MYIYVSENYGKWPVAIKNMRYKGCIKKFVLINPKGLKNQDFDKRTGRHNIIKCQNSLTFHAVPVKFLNFLKFLGESEQARNSERKIMEGEVGLVDIKIV